MASRTGLPPNRSVVAADNLVDIPDTLPERSPGPYQGYINGASWERKGVRYQFRALVPGTVSEEQAEAIVRHVLQVLDERSDQNGG